MPISVLLNDEDISSQIDFQTLTATQNLTNSVDTANFSFIKKPGRVLPEFNDDIVIQDGGSVIFAGIVMQVKQSITNQAVEIIEVSCVDYTAVFDRILAAMTYENQTVGYIIADLVSQFAPDFTTDNADSSFVIPKIVFNQVTLSDCMTKLANIVSYNWYIDENKDIHFFDKFSKTAPFGLTDVNGKYIYNTLQFTEDGSQLVNRVKVRGGQYDGATYSDIITVKGNDTKSFKLPYNFSNLTIELSTGGAYVSKVVGIDFIDDFTTKDVLYNYQDQSFHFNNPLADGNKIRFTGNPKVDVMAIAEDSDSIKKLRDKYKTIHGVDAPAGYGIIEKLIRDDSISSNTIARKRAAAELLTYAEAVVDLSFETHEPGLKDGQLINIQSNNRDFDEDVLIKKLQFKTLTPFDFTYKVSCISTQKYTLIDLLKKFLQPASMSSDAQEVSERLFVVNENVKITDEPTFVAPFLYEEAVAVTDDVYKNAVAPASVEWVYGYYAPTSVADPKRMARYDRGAKYG